MKGFLMAILLLPVVNSYAADCGSLGHCDEQITNTSHDMNPCDGVSAWTKGTVYLEGDQVSRQGATYHANWWTQSDDPVTHNGARGTGEPWTLMAACDSTTDVRGTDNNGGNSFNENENSGTGVCEDVSTWATGMVYVKGDLVTYQGDKYRANWWTRSNNPATNNGPQGSGNPWTMIGSCDAGDNNPRPTNQSPTASASGPSESVVGKSITFSSVGSFDPDGDSIRFTWNFGDGSSSDYANPIHSYSRAGTYSVVLTVTDVFGLQTAAQTTIVIKPVETSPPQEAKKIIGYFTEWGVYGRNYHVKNLVTSGSADRLTHIIYAFGKTKGGLCSISDSYAAYEKFYSAADSIDGVADTRETGALRGNFNQLLKLKQLYPNLKVVWSFGGWTSSGGFTEAVKNPELFADSCYRLVNDERWSGLFDGIDIDWEFPNYCGLTCDNSGFDAYRELMAALRSRFGNQLVTASITSSPRKMDATDYAGAALYLDFYMVMTYDFFGAYAANGPTAPHSPLYDYPQIPIAGFSSDSAIQKLKSLGIPAEKMLLGIGFYGRGWSGVTQAAPGGSATGAAAGTYEQGFEAYKVLKNTCPATGTVGGTAYAWCDGNWWGYDTPETILGKMEYVKHQGLAGAFFWQFGGDTSDGELIRAIDNGL